jgi:hypothetical protein
MEWNKNLFLLFLVSEQFVANARKVRRILFFRSRMHIASNINKF